MTTTSRSFGSGGPSATRPGPIVDEEGQVLGTHHGIEGFTIGQRRGLGIALGSPRYVVQIEPATRTVTIGRRESLERIGLEAVRFNWQGPEPRGAGPLPGPDPCPARGRARDGGATGRRPGPSGFRLSPDCCHPGQVVTVYQEDLVLGGGWIEKAICAEFADEGAP